MRAYDVEMTFGGVKGAKHHLCASTMARNVSKAMENVLQQQEIDVKVLVSVKITLKN